LPLPIGEMSGAPRGRGTCDELLCWIVNACDGHTTSDASLSEAQAGVRNRGRTGDPGPSTAHIGVVLLFVPNGGAASANGSEPGD
jgi:hypothetical protein